jgi:hypothetical protein
VVFFVCAAVPFFFVCHAMLSLFHLHAFYDKGRADEWPNLPLNFYIFFIAIKCENCVIP